MLQTALCPYSKTRKETTMNKFKQKLLAGEKLIGFEIDLCDPCISEMVGQVGFDYLWIDSEHEAMDYETILMHIIAAKAGGAASIVRIPCNEPYLAKRILEMGPDGIIFPQVNNAGELRKAMDACMYPPYGTRGFGPRRACGYGRENLFDYIQKVPDRMCRFAQIEHIDAVHDLDEMLKVPYVDGFIVGPCDLSGSIGHLNDIFCPENLELIDIIVEKCHKAGMPVGVAVGATSEEDMRFWYDRGMQFISAGSDISAIVSKALEQYAVMSKVFYSSK